MCGVVAIADHPIRIEVAAMTFARPQARSAEGEFRRMACPRLGVRLSGNYKASIKHCKLAGGLSLQQL